MTGRTTWITLTGFKSGVIRCGKPAVHFHKKMFYAFYTIFLKRLGLNYNFPKVLLLLTAVATTAYAGSINVTHNGPVMYGANISFHASLTNLSVEDVVVVWIWEDDADPPNATKFSNASESFLTRSYDTPGNYLMTVTAIFHKYDNATGAIAFQISDDCTSNDDCFIDNSECNAVTNDCQCLEGYTAMKNGLQLIKCRLSCYIDEDCGFYEECNGSDSKCVCKHGNKEPGIVAACPGVPCSYSMECGLYERCVAPRCKCHYGMKLNLRERMVCLSAKQCKRTSDCGSIPNAYCDDDTCICETADTEVYDSNNILTKCSRNENYCTDTAQCGKNSICSTMTKRCVCQVNYQEEYDLFGKLTCYAEVYRPPMWIVPVGVSVAAVVVLACLAVWFCLKRHKLLRRNSTNTSWVADPSITTTSPNASTNTLPPAYDNPHYVYDDPPPPYEQVVASSATTTLPG